MVKRKKDKPKTKAPAKVRLQPGVMDARGEVNRFAAQHGAYAEETVVDLSGELGEGRQRQFRVVRNRGGTAVERWILNESLDRAQAEAIAFYCRAWRLAIGEQRVSTNYSLVATFRGTAPSDFLPDKVAAMRALKDLDSAVFDCFPRHIRECWQNVVIFDEAAGVAGSRLGYRSKQAEAAAKTTVQLIAGMIARIYRLGPAV